MPRTKSKTKTLSMALRATIYKDSVDTFTINLPLKDCPKEAVFLFVQIPMRLTKNIQSDNLKANVKSKESALAGASMEKRNKHD